MTKRMHLNWKGDACAREVREAAAYGINETLKRSVISAKQNHPGWQNRTANAEGSIRVQDVANAANLLGRWGSIGVKYMRRLEYEHGAALRNSADVNYPQLNDIIKGRLP